MSEYDYLIVGAGLFGCVFAHEMAKAGKKCLVIDRRSHIGGNCYTENVNGINVHRYGPHIFHTDDEEVWDFVNQFAKFNRFTNMPVARYKNETYSLPFNMHTFHEMWGVNTPEEALKIIEAQKQEYCVKNPSNLEEQAISMVGRDIYEKLVKEYTEKQWGRSCKELPSSIIKRLPVRFTYDNSYFNSIYQGVPIGGYTPIFSSLLRGIDVLLNTDFITDRVELIEMADAVIFTGCIDEYYEKCFGALDYRSVTFDEIMLNTENYQGNAVVNYTSADYPWNRAIEHKHFENKKTPWTIVSYEYSVPYDGTNEPSYPINDQKNNELYGRYKAIADKEERVVFGGRLGLYRYMDMDVTVRAALDLAKRLI